MEPKQVLIFVCLLVLADSAPLNRNIVNRYMPQVRQIQSRLKSHSAAQRNTNPNGTQKFNSVSELVNRLRAPYHPNVGFYTPLKPPLTGLTDPRCTQLGMLGCGNRCFVPLNTRCLGNQIIGPEQSIDGALLPSIGDLLPSLIGTFISEASKVGIAGVRNNVG